MKLARAGNLALASLLSLSVAAAPRIAHAQSATVSSESAAEDKTHAPATGPTGMRSPVAFGVGVTLAVTGSLATLTGGLMVLVAIGSECGASPCDTSDVAYLGLGIGLGGLAALIGGAGLSVYGSQQVPVAEPARAMRSPSLWPEVRLGTSSAALRWSF
ncbi:MAG: hypothetical protein U0326_44410 [Polyangiales bacterium]